MQFLKDNFCNHYLHYFAVRKNSCAELSDRTNELYFRLQPIAQQMVLTVKTSGENLINEFMVVQKTFKGFKITG
jgi:hypothetical protein